MIIKLRNRKRNTVRDNYNFLYTLNIIIMKMSPTYGWHKPNEISDIHRKYDN